MKISRCVKYTKKERRKQLGENVKVIAKRGMYVIVAVILLAAAAYIVPLPLKVNASLQGIQWENESGSLAAEKCTVKAEGWYYCYLLKDDIFKGSIRLSCSDKSQNNDILELSFRTSQYGGKSSAFWIYNKKENRVESLGEIMVQGAFKSVLISLNEGGMVSAPAENRDEAVALALELGYGELLNN